MSETVTYGAPARAGDRIHRLSARVGRAPLTLVGRAALAAIADAGQEPTDIQDRARQLQRRRGKRPRVPNIMYGYQRLGRRILAGIVGLR